MQIAGVVVLFLSAIGYLVYKFLPSKKTAHGDCDKCN
jgi:cbb3-type cytochrome oxidase subunit 3